MRMIRVILTSDSNERAFEFTVFKTHMAQRKARA